MFASFIRFVAAETLRFLVWSVAVTVAALVAVLAAGGTVSFPLPP